MSKPMSIEIVADWFLSKESMTQKKIQKLCYYAVAWGWTLMDRSVANNDRFEAWVHGPASPVLYRKYRGNGWNKVAQQKKTPALPTDINELLIAVWATYGDKDGNELEALSHSEDPWKKARIGLSETERGNKQIKPEDMKTYYKSIYTGDE